MNREHVQDLYNRLSILKQKGRERRFDMKDYIFSGKITANPLECGAAACLAGWAAMIAHEHDPDEYLLEWVESAPDEVAQEWLGLSDEQADHWFLAGWHPSGSIAIAMEEISLDDALVFLAKELEVANQ